MASIDLSASHRAAYASSTNSSVSSSQNPPTTPVPAASVLPAVSAASPSAADASPTTSATIPATTPAPAPSTPKAGVAPRSWASIAAASSVSSAAAAPAAVSSPSAPQSSSVTASRSPSLPLRSSPPVSLPPSSAWSTGRPLVVADEAAATAAEAVLFGGRTAAAAVRAQLAVLRVSRGALMDAAAEPWLPRGLVNVGNACFTNVVLQALMACGPFRIFLRALDAPEVVLPPTTAPLLSRFVRLAAEMNNSGKLKANAFGAPRRGGPSTADFSAAGGVAYRPSGRYLSADDDDEDDEEETQTQTDVSRATEPAAAVRKASNGAAEGPKAGSPTSLSGATNVPTTDRASKTGTEGSDGSVAKARTSTRSPSPASLPPPPSGWASNGGQAGPADGGVALGAPAVKRAKGKSADGGTAAPKGAAAHSTRRVIPCEPLLPDYLYDALPATGSSSGTDSGSVGGARGQLGRRIRNEGAAVRDLMARGSQEDAQEFLTHVLNALHEELVALIAAPRAASDGQAAGNAGGDGLTNVASGTETGGSDVGWSEVGRGGRTAVVVRSAGEFAQSVVTSIFGGTLRSELIRRDGASSVTREPFLCLQLDVDRGGLVRGLRDALRLYFEPEALEGFTSESTRQAVEARKHVTLDRLPQVLILHLKRFAHNAATGALTKIARAIEFPETLYVEPGLLSSISVAPASDHRAYALTGVVTHVGRETAGGHYIVDVRRSAAAEVHAGVVASSPLAPSSAGATVPAVPAAAGPRGAPHDGAAAGNGVLPPRASADAWATCDDNIVTDVQPTAVLRRQAYLLFYTRKSQLLPPPIVGG